MLSVVIAGDQGCLDLLHAGLHVVAGEEPRHTVHDPFPPSVVVLPDNVDDGVLRE